VPRHLEDGLAHSTVVMVLSRMRQVLESDADRAAVLTRFVEDLPAGDESCCGNSSATPGH
jgi:hypothetical protein